MTTFNLPRRTMLALFVLFAVATVVTALPKRKKWIVSGTDNSFTFEGQFQHKYRHVMKPSYRASKRSGVATLGDPEPTYVMEFDGKICGFERTSRTPPRLYGGPTTTRQEYRVMIGTGTCADGPTLPFGGTFKPRCRGPQGKKRPKTPSRENCCRRWTARRGSNPNTNTPAIKNTDLTISSGAIFLVHPTSGSTLACVDFTPK